MTPSDWGSFDKVKKLQILEFAELSDDDKHMSLMAMYRFFVSVQTRRQEQGFPLAQEPHVDSDCEQMTTGDGSKGEESEIL